MPAIEPLHLVCRVQICEAVVSTSADILEEDHIKGSAEPSDRPIDRAALTGDTFHLPIFNHFIPPKIGRQHASSQINIFNGSSRGGAPQAVNSDNFGAPYLSRITFPNQPGDGTTVDLRNSGWPSRRR
jgi:hypothetical protein